MTIKINMTKYKNYGRCVELSNGKIKALITVDIGPRIIFYGTADGRNVMLEDIEREVSSGGAYFDKNFTAGERWYIYGGHRMWKAPEDDASYVPDNYPVKYILGDNFSEFFPPVQTNTRFCFKIRVSMSENGALTVVHTMENLGSVTANVAVWALTVLRPGGAEIIPLNTTDTGFLPNNYFSYWPYNDINDKRLTGIDGYLLLKQDKDIKRAFKLGTLNKKGFAAYGVDGLLFIKKFPYINGAVYPDNNCNFETYTNNLFLEMETLSPLCAVEPGGSISHTEEFMLFEQILDTKTLLLDKFFTDKTKEQI
ncbi:MAG: hypothetical protein LBQ27_04740 [Clostridiales bacterium]|nr:hypothetical protein [Clostridiales bacterium]